MNHKKKIVFWLLMIVTTVAASFFAAEIMVRVFASPTSGAQPGPYINHGGFYTFSPHATETFVNEAGQKIVIKTDKYGLRNPPGALAQANVILLGDSFITADNTPQKFTLAGRLEAKGIKVYNAGMDGFGTFQSLALLRHLLDKTQARTIILCFYLGNDFRDNYFARISQPGAPDAATPDKISGTKLFLSSLWQKSRLLMFLYNRFYVGLIKGEAGNRIAGYSLSEMMSYQLPNSQDMNKAAGKTLLALEELAKLAKARHLHVYVVGIPSKAQVYKSFHEVSAFSVDKRSKPFALKVIRGGYSFDHPDRMLRDLTEKAGLTYISLLPVFRKNSQQPLYYQIDVHWTAVGQKLAADYIFAKLNHIRQ
jgi:hypothetical protein